MKKINIILLIFPAFLFLTSCLDVFDNSISGDGNVVTEKRPVDRFDAIEASSGLNVNVRFGESTNEVEVVADSNLHSYIRTEVRGGVLRIKTDRSIRHARSKDIYVNVQTLKSIGVSSAADVKGENRLVTDELRIDVSSAGDLTLDLEAKVLHIGVSSSGDARLSGKVEKLTAEVSSAGDLKARDLETDNCRAEASSAGDIELTVNGELSASASSAGTIRYSGNPSIRNISTSSAGNITKY